MLKKIIYKKINRLNKARRCNTMETFSTGSEVRFPFFCCSPLDCAGHYGSMAQYQTLPGSFLFWEAMMVAPKGNRFWELRSSHGRAPIFETPKDLWSASCEYFQWNEDNPLYEEKVFHSQGEITTHQHPKMRAMTIEALCLYLDISLETFSNYSKKQDFVGVTNKIRRTIYRQKFEGASADFLNSNIIARDLGLKDVNKQEITGADGKDLKWTVEVVDAEEKKVDE